MNPDELEALALRVALDAHRGQVDKGGAAYIWHPIRVALSFNSAALRAIALLHDTLEDSGLTADELRHDFGDTIADAVVALTRRKGQSYEGFIKQCAMNELARAVKLADLADNMNVERLPPPMTDTDLARLAKYSSAVTTLRAHLERTRP